MGFISFMYFCNEFWNEFWQVLEQVLEAPGTSLGTSPGTGLPGLPGDESWESPWSLGRARGTPTGHQELAKRRPAVHLTFWLSLNCRGVAGGTRCLVGGLPAPSRPAARVAFGRTRYESPIHLLGTLQGWRLRNGALVFLSLLRGALLPNTTWHAPGSLFFHTAQ